MQEVVGSHNWTWHPLRPSVGPPALRKHNLPLAFLYQICDK